MPAQVNYIAYLRIVATLAVVLIHASTGYLNSTYIQDFDWNYANILHSFTRLSVPIFVMISGALLLPKEESPLEFYRKRLLTILPIFLFWTCVYLIYALWKQPRLSSLSSSQLLHIILPKLRSGANAHLWYLYLLVGLYLAIPFLHKLVKACSKRELELFIGIWWISLFFSNKVFSLYLPSIDMGFFTGYFGYLVLGYYLAQFGFKSSSIKLKAGALYLIIAGFTALGTYYLSLDQGGLNPLLYGYTAPNTAVAAAAVFVFFRYLPLQENIARPLNWVNSYSFGIYLSHILFLNYIHPLLPLSTAWKIPTATILTVACSILLSSLLRKLPYGKEITG